MHWQGKSVQIDELAFVPAQTTFISQQCDRTLMAEWTKVGEKNSTVQYIDYSTIRKEGNLSKVWGLQDRKKPDGEGAISDRLLIEIDCKEESYRLLKGIKQLLFCKFPESGFGLL